MFKPLELNVTRPTSVTDIIPGRADSYDWQDHRWRNAIDLLALRPSGAFVSNILDLAKWDAALYTDNILKLQVRRQMWTPVKLNNGSAHPYGFGWQLGDINGHKIVHHGGTLSGFRAEFARFVDDKLTVIVLTNCLDAKPDEMALGVAGFYLPALVPSKEK